MLEFFFYFINISLVINITFLLLIDEEQFKIIRIISFIYSTIVFLAVINFIINLDFSTIIIKLFSITLSSYLNIKLTIGIDQCNVMFLLLTTILFPIVVLASWTTIKFNLKFFYFLIALLEYILINVFLSFDLFFFYIWFEASIIPMFLMIIYWGVNPNRIRAAFYFVLYTVFFSLPFLYSIIYIYDLLGTTNVYFLTYNVVLDVNAQKYLMWFFFLRLVLSCQFFHYIYDYQKLMLKHLPADQWF